VIRITTTVCSDGASYTSRPSKNFVNIPSTTFLMSYRQAAKETVRQIMWKQYNHRQPWLLSVVSVITRRNCRRYTSCVRTQGVLNTSICVQSQTDIFVLYL